MRDTDNQMQNEDDLSRDTDNAYEKLGAIFGKDEEQKRIDRNQLIGEIGQQIKDIAVTDAKIKATEKINAQNHQPTDEEREAAKKELAKQGKETSNENADSYIKEQAIQAEINK